MVTSKLQPLSIPISNTKGLQGQHALHVLGIQCMYYYVVVYHVYNNEIARKGHTVVKLDIIRLCYDCRSW